MQLTNVIAAFSLASAVSACVDFGASINSAQYATISLNDNGRKTCEFTGYGGDNKGWNLKCVSGYSGRFRWTDKVVEYKAPHGQWTFATQCDDKGFPQGPITVCTARVFGC